MFTVCFYEFHAVSYSGSCGEQIIDFVQSMLVLLPLRHLLKAQVKKFENLMDYFHNDVNSFEILSCTSLALISCGSKSQKRALLLAMLEIVLYVSLQHNDMMTYISCCTGIHISQIEFSCETDLFLILFVQSSR